MLFPLRFPTQEILRFVVALHLDCLLFRTGALKEALYGHSPLLELSHGVAKLWYDQYSHESCLKLNVSFLCEILTFLFWIPFSTLSKRWVFFNFFPQTKFLCNWHVPPESFNFHEMAFWDRKKSCWKMFDQLSFSVYMSVTKYTHFQENVWSPSLFLHHWWW